MYLEIIMALVICIILLLIRRTRVDDVQIVTHYHTIYATHTRIRVKRHKNRRRVRRSRRKQAEPEYVSPLEYWQQHGFLPESV